MQTRTLASSPRTLPWSAAAAALGTAAAMALFALAVRAPADRAEGLYLAVLAAPVLFATLVLAEGSRGAQLAGLLPAGCLLAALALPPGPLRGATVGALLAVGLALAVVGSPRLRSAGGWIVAALAAQVLLEARALLDVGVDLDSVLRFLVLPVLGGSALAWIAARVGTVPALLALLQLLLCYGRFDALAVSTVAAFAAAVELSLRSAPKLETLRRPQVAACLVVLALPLLVAPRAGLLAVTAALALVMGRRWFALLLVVAGLLLVAAGITPWTDVLARLPATILLLLPVLAYGLSSAIALALVTAFPLAVVGLRALEVGPALAPAALVLALLPPVLARRSDPIAAPASRWARPVAALLLAFPLVLSAYPWLRTQPAVAHVARVSPDAPPRQLLLEWPPVTLGPRAPSLELPIDSLAAGPVEVAIDSALANGIDLPATTTVARVVLGTAEHEAASWLLRVGSATGEWAAGRADLREAGTSAPSPWLSWVEDRGGFFGQRYRVRFTGVAPEAEGATLRIERSPELPEAVTLTLFQVALGRDAPQP